MILDSDFHSTLEHKEILPIDSIAFPYACFHTDLDLYVDHCIPWHWHPFFEFDYISDNAVDFLTVDKVFHLKKGDLFFINSGVMHEVRGNGNQLNFKVYAQLFDMHFLSGMYNNIFEQKYMLPILNHKELEAYVIHPDSYRRIQMIELFLKIVEQNRQEEFGYEFEIRAGLSRLWCLLLEETEHLRVPNYEKNTLDIERLKIMMEFVHTHYMEKITLEDISRSAAVSGRECGRCFQRCIKLSPMNYLNEHRIRIAAEMLLQTSHSITRISEDCGFRSSSYFSKVFQEKMNCTPKHYRRNRAASACSITCSRSPVLR